MEPVTVPPRSSASAIRPVTYMNAGCGGALALASCAPVASSVVRSVGDSTSSDATAIPAAVLNRAVVAARFTVPAGRPAV